VETLRLETDGPVTWVWLDRPERRNSFDQTTLTELRESFEMLDADETVGAVVLAARGPVFSAGFDVEWMLRLTAKTVRQELAGIRAVYDTIEGCSKPFIVAVDGPAVGGGLLLALTADIRLATERAGFGAPEVKIGIFPSLDLVPRLERIVGLGMAKRMVLTGDMISASEAEGSGLVGRLISPDSLLDEAGTLARDLADLPPMGVQTAKKAFAASRRPGHAEWEIDAFTRCWTSPEREPAMRAFLQSR